MAEPKITHLERRKIEAGVLIPVVEALQDRIGEDRANEIVADVIRDLAREDGRRWAERFGNDLAAMARVSEVWSAGGGLDVEWLGKSPRSLDFNVTRCRYAEYFKEIGLPELGRLFHCNRDFAMVEGFNAGLKLRRTQTIMEGADYCDFRFRDGT